MLFIDTYFDMFNLSKCQRKPKNNQVYKNPETWETLRTTNKTKTYKAKNSTIFLKKISNTKQKETKVNSGAREGLAVPGTHMVKSGNILVGDRGKKTKTK